MPRFQVHVKEATGSKQYNHPSKGVVSPVVFNDEDFDHATPSAAGEFVVVMKDGGRLICVGSVDDLVG